MRYKFLPILLCTALLLCVPAFAETLGGTVDAWCVTLADGVELTETAFWTGNDLRTEHYLSRSPEAAAVPVVVSSDMLWSKTALTEAAAALQARGLHVLGGSNGGFYTIATGEPVGIVVSGGVLRADDAWLEAVGFRADGSTVFGKPETKLTLLAGGESVALTALNRAPGAGLRAYTYDATDAVQPEGESWCVFCTVSGTLPMRGSVSLSVEEIRETEERIVVPEGKILLLMVKEEGEDAQALPAMLVEGAELTLECTCADGWEDVESAVGILYPMLADGEIIAGLNAASAPRTAVGRKADGTVILYTIDGRQSGYSTGAGLTDVARRMKELGCVTAGALDGGGSTQLAAVLPGDESLTTVNRPSDGSTRLVVNYILLAAPDSVPGSAARITAYPFSIHAVAGAKIPLTAKITDKNGYPLDISRAMRYQVSSGLGEVRDDVFLAAGTGSGTITVSSAGMADGTIPVTVTESPEEIVLYGEVYGRKTSSLTLAPGQEVDLTVRAYDRHVLLTGDDTCYEWNLDPAAGTVDGTGHLVPGEISVTGMLRVSAGESFTEIPITVWTGVPFTDVAVSDSYFNAVRYVFEHDIFQGTGETTFEPHTVMNRGMLVTVLWRMCGKPAAKSAAAFADVAPDSWYGPAVAWAAESGLVFGYSETEFAPTDDLSKEQILTILHRWAGEPAPSGDLNFELEDTQDYARTAMQWALENRLIEPQDTEGLQPHISMERAAVAEVLMRWEDLPQEEK